MGGVKAGPLRTKNFFKKNVTIKLEGRGQLVVGPLNKELFAASQRILYFYVRIFITNVIL